MTKPTVLCVLEHDGFLTIFAPDEVEVKVAETWDEQLYDVGPADEQVKQAAPHLHQTLYRDDFIRATGKPKPYGGGGKQTIWERLVDLVGDAEKLGRKYNLDLNLLEKLKEIVSSPE